MKEFTIVRGLFDNRKRQLILDKNFIKFENKDRKGDLFTVINKEDITGIRYGIQFINGYSFYIGREYLIYIKTISNHEIKINFKLFYGRKLQEKHQLFYDIIDELWNNYLDDLSQSYLNKIISGENFELCGVQFLTDKIKFNNKELLFKNLEIKKYKHHYLIYSNQNEYQNKMLYYLKDENAVILSNLLTIIKNNGQY
ncbi:hypothetical protein NZ698_05125 [Chryseobacterium sp. PBS4-4]|uniref:DUF3137 domain-containing protein n=1 Tax=Chryseobacterium edaphi TaxID=2976532 RepID=A0ABT2W2W3_9FLAO|nr:hypothetical protein [Chryseobacterium edaphi]MCU7616570.1 hypothetical protein [Chryseobacterium edaphi]